MKKFKYLNQRTPLILLFIAICCSSCCKKSWNELSPDELSWLPYNVGDTIRFKSNLGNYDKWIVKSKKYEELSYGKGTTKCALSYYHGLYVILFNVKDSISYEFVIGRDSWDGGPGISIRSNTPGDIAVAYDSSKSDTLRIEGGQYLKKISSVKSYLLKKGLGLKEYVTNDSLETYEKN